MKILKLPISLFTILFSKGSVSIGQANKIEKKFIDTSLVDINTVDSSIQVDLINSDSKKSIFEKTSSIDWARHI